MEALLISLPVLIFSVVLHEVAHGYAARAQGDNTAAMLGRLTLNPLPHVDPIGSVLVPGLLALTGTGLILGWAKPVPVNPRNFRDYVRGDIIVSLAGVAANLLLVLVATLLLAAVAWGARHFPGAGTAWALLAQTADFGILINLVLILFNLLPIPPLDGSHVFYHLLPPELGARYRELGRYGMLILFGLLFLTRFSFLTLPLFWLYGIARAFAGVLSGGFI
ncbi:site-2 protease family protein [soil metagenome]